jgi:hypothetical protein
MYTRIIRVQYEKSGDYVVLAFLGDPHIGSLTCDIDRYQEAINATKNLSKQAMTYWFGMGDWAHAIAPHPVEKRFDFDSLDPDLMTPDKQYAKSEEMLRQLTGQPTIQCATILTGNHDDVLRVRHYHDFVATMARNLGLEYGGVNAAINFIFERGKHHSQLSVYVNHGCGNCNAIGAKIKKVIDLAQTIDADMYAIGHVHQALYLPLPKLSVDAEGKIREIEQHFVLTGSFQRGYPAGATADFVEKQMLRPVKLGGIAFRFWPEARKFEMLEI